MEALNLVTRRNNAAAENIKTPTDKSPRVQSGQCFVVSVM